jgi:hypothetical protein
MTRQGEVPARRTRVVFRGMEDHADVADSV